MNSAMSKNYAIGIDFDNTLVNYDEIMYILALEQSLVDSNTSKSKKDIRDKIRQLPDGEIEWQKLQAIVYGPRMGDARLINGVQEFFEYCKHYKFRVNIISHKTEFANYDKTGTNLREAALTWMRDNSFFKPNGLGLSRGDVYFESTRYEKIERINNVKCTHFIDDLVEIFLEDSFPKSVEKILFAPHKKHLSLQGIKVVATWKEIKEYFFVEINDDRK